MLKIIFSGNLGNDAEVKNVNGTNAISFSVAHTEKYRGRDGQTVENTTWMRCTLWRKPEASSIAQYLKKGTKVLIEGKPEARAYVTSAGQAAASLEVRVDNVELMSGNTQQQQQQPSVSTQRLAQPVPIQQPQRQVQVGDTIHQMDDDSLPF
jgi:single-strand DNA-binding protein